MFQSIGNKNKETVIDFQSGHWLPADRIKRSFVKYAYPNDSPGTIWQYALDNSQIILSVVIPTFDACRNGYFLKLLNQLNRQSLKHFEIIVVRGDPRQGRAINIGVAIARGSYILTLDDDTSLSDPDTFHKLVAVMEAHQEIGIAGGNNVIPEDANPFIRRVMKEIPRRSWQPVQKITDSDMAEHPLMIMRKEVFKEIGCENEILPRGLYPYLRQKYREKGYRVVVVPNVFYSHLPPPTLNKLIKQFFRNGFHAAFCNKFYPQWVIETPDYHGNGFMSQRPFHFRVARFISGMAKKTAKWHFVYFIVYMAYAVGFIWGYIVQKKSVSK
jgi:glycosyltransferase involved in cell wall biosynthesis